MTRAEIIAKLKEAKGPLEIDDAEKIVDYISALNLFTHQKWSLTLVNALIQEHPHSIPFAISLVEREKPGWQKNIVDYSGAAPAKACIGSSISGTWHEGATPAIALVIALLSADPTP